MPLAKESLFALVGHGSVPFTSASQALQAQWPVQSAFKLVPFIHPVHVILETS